MKWEGRAEMAWDRGSEINTNNIGRISQAVLGSLFRLSCCLFPEACTWAKQTHLDKESSNGDRGTQCKYTSNWGGKGRKWTALKISQYSTTFSSLVKLLQWHEHLIKKSIHLNESLASLLVRYLCMSQKIHNMVRLDYLFSSLSTEGIETSLMEHKRYKWIKKTLI